MEILEIPARPFSTGDGMVQGNLPVKRMVLYKHGVGFIERGGVAEGGLVKLSFKRDEMGDILKSLSIFVKGKGQVTGVSYETADDISKLLAEKAINVPDREAMVGLLRALKGYRVKLWAAGEAVEGKVVGTDEDTRVNPAGNEIGRKSSVVVQADDERIRSFDIDAIQGLQVQDAEAGEDLKFFLGRCDLGAQEEHEGRHHFRRGREARPLGELQSPRCPPGPCPCPGRAPDCRDPRQGLRRTRLPVRVAGRLRGGLVPTRRGEF